MGKAYPSPTFLLSPQRKRSSAKADDVLVEEDAGEGEDAWEAEDAEGENGREEEGGEEERPA
jgi:hypothetical protein